MTVGGSPLYFVAMRYALRSLAKNPGFAAVAILAIALGVGPNSAVFSIVHAVLLQPLPIPAADRIVIIWGTNRARNNEQTASLRARSRSTGGARRAFSTASQPEMRPPISVST